jgi:serine/threonine-protein kinase
MEWLQGSTIEQRLCAQERFDLVPTLDILDQMCDALEAAHEKGIVHRDLKPANVFLVPRRGRRDLVKLLDFGVAKLLQPADEPGHCATPQTLAGRLVGTPEYLAPEQARGQPVDGRADIYALGVMTFEMALGRLPFIADSIIDVIGMHLSTPPPAPRSLWPEIPPVLDGLILGMLQKDPAQRLTLPQVRAAVSTLRGVPPGNLEGAPSSEQMPLAKPQATDQRVTTPMAGHHTRRPATLLVAGVGAALMAIGGVNALYHRAPQARAARAPIMAAPPRRFVIEVDATQAQLEVDARSRLLHGAKIARLQIKDPGEHEVRVIGPGVSPSVRRIVVKAGATVHIAIALPRARAPSSQKSAREANGSRHLADARPRRLSLR